MHIVITLACISFDPELADVGQQVNAIVQDKIKLEGCRVFAKKCLNESIMDYVDESRILCESPRQLEIPHYDSHGLSKRQNYLDLVTSPAY